MDKKLIMLCMTVGSFVGSYVPTLWGDTSFFSIRRRIFSALGGIAGIYAGWRIQDY